MELTYLHKYDSALAELKARIYLEKIQNKKNFVEIGELLSIPSSQVKFLYKQAKALRTNGDYSWLEGLSNRAITQIKKTPYIDFQSLCFDVLNDRIDLEDFDWIGKKVSREVRIWCKDKLCIEDYSVPPHT